MRLILFAGPTLPADEIRARLDSTVLPPAAMGDVLQATRRRPDAIALIDGVFERVLSVWHKEILWALAQGIHVFGASSMGALRAAELHAFGMVGVGRIFEAYRSGALEADDEVALLHGPAEIGFAAVTEALVNVRATLARAEAEGLLTAEAAAALLTRARMLHYRERTWDVILQAYGEGPAAARLRDWLPGRRVDQKRLDALELLDVLGSFLAGRPPPFVPGFTLAWTEVWDALHRHGERSSSHHSVLDELRLRPDEHAAVLRSALLRSLARREAERSGVHGELGQAAEALRERHGLWRRADLDAWLAAMDLGADGFDALLAEEAALGRLLGQEEDRLDQALLSELRSSGRYAELAARARDKRHRLAEAGLDGLSAAEAGVDLGPALARFAQSGSHALGHGGFGDRTRLERALLHEILFLRIMSANSDGAAETPSDTQPADTTRLGGIDD